MKTRVAVVGATGYSGGELTAILARHPHVEIAGLYSSAGGSGAPFGSLHPSLGGRSGPDASPFTLEALRASGPRVVFLATPHETSAELAPALLAAGMRVVDISGAFRIRDEKAFRAWYGFPHPSPQLLPEAVYGLTEWCDGALASARLVANPGCYPTSVLLALKPLASLLDPGQPIVCSSASGVSGAGKKSDLAYSFTELAGSFKAYGIGNHRHEIEMRQELSLSETAPFVFVPHLLPVVRGILSTITVSFSRAVAPEELAAAYAAAYAGRPFVGVRPAGKTPELKDVTGTPRAEIGFVALPGGRRAVIVSAIDNLLKGAASQAVQNLNRMLGLPETEGLW